MQKTKDQNLQKPVPTYVFPNAVCTGVLLTVPEGIGWHIPGTVPSREKKSTTEDHPSLGLYPGNSWAPVGHWGMSTNGMSVSCQVQNGFCMGVACESCILHHCVLYTCNIQYISVHVFTVAALVPSQQLQSWLMSFTNCHLQCWYTVCPLCSAVEIQIAKN